MERRTSATATLSALGLRETSSQRRQPILPAPARDTPRGVAVPSAERRKLISPDLPILCERVELRELSLARPQIGDSIAELRVQIEEIKSRALPPSDADSFLESLGFWVSRRGYYASMRKSSRSLEKWFGFVFGYDESATQRWAQLSVEVLRLY